MDLYAFTDTMSSPSPIAIPSPFLIAKSRPKEWKQQQTESSIFTNHNKLKTRAALGRAEKTLRQCGKLGTPRTFNSRRPALCCTNRTGRLRKWPVIVSVERRLAVLALRKLSICWAGHTTSQSAVESAATFNHRLNQPCELHVRSTANSALADSGSFVWSRSRVRIPLDPHATMQVSIFAGFNLRVRSKLLRVLSKTRH